MSNDHTINTLQLVTTRRPFFEQQINVLERHGVSCTILPVPHRTGDTRSVFDYLRFHGTTLRRVFKEEFDIVHANYGLTAPTALFQPARPIVLSLWGSDVLGKYQWLSNFCSQFCDAVIVMTEEMADQINCKTYVIPHGIDMGRFTDEPADQAREKVGWKADAKHVLFPYDPSRSVKNYDRAASIADAVDSRLDEPVEIHPLFGAPHERVPIYMNAADALLLTSKYEGSPNTVKEALACNLPVVSTDVGDTSDVVDGIDNSGVGKTDDQLIQLLDDAVTSNGCVNGRARIHEYSLERMARDIREIYDDILAETRTSM